MADCHIGGKSPDPRRVYRLGGAHTVKEAGVPALRLTVEKDSQKNVGC
jgi:hypothetical protein